jgi:Protein of unknown function (DUF4230)
MLILLIALAIALFCSSFTLKDNLEKKCELVAEKLVTISELATIKYNYSNVISIKNSLKYKDFIIPFTEKSCVIKYNGYITAGVDLSKALISAENKELLISLPPSTILNHTVNEEEIFIFDEKSSAFNKLNIGDMLKEIISEKEKTEEELIKEGFLKKVDEDTIKFLQGFFKELGYDNIRFL